VKAFSKSSLDKSVGVLGLSKASKTAFLFLFLIMKLISSQSVIKTNIYKVLNDLKEKDIRYNLLSNEDDEIDIKY
jgi:hypothetical protein